MDPGLKTKVALVTGGSMGIGKATAMTLAQQGAEVAVCARGLDSLKATAREIKDATGSQVISIRADMTSAEDIKMLALPVRWRWLLMLCRIPTIQRTESVPFGRGCGGGSEQRSGRRTPSKNGDSRRPGKWGYEWIWY